MVTNLVDAIRTNLGYPPLEKVDPNSQEIKGAKKMSSAAKIAAGCHPCSSRRDDKIQRRTRWS